MCVQESVQDLQEDTQSKLNQAWEGMAARADECDAHAAVTRAELLQADGSLMALLRDLGDTVERLELQDVADLGGRLDEMKAAQDEGLSAVEELVEERSRVCFRCPGLCAWYLYYCTPCMLKLLCRVTVSMPHAYPTCTALLAVSMTTVSLC